VLHTIWFRKKNSLNFLLVLAVDTIDSFLCATSSIYVVVQEVRFNKTMLRALLVCQIIVGIYPLFLFLDMED